MGNALDAFRAQREAVEDLNSRIRDVSTLLNQVQRDMKLLTADQQLREFLNDQRTWLGRTEQSIARLDALRRNDMHRVGRSIVWRWALATLFAFIAIAVASAAHGRMARTTSAETQLRQERARFAEVIERRFIELTPAERRLFEQLMGWDSPSQPEAQRSATKQSQAPR